MGDDGDIMEEGGDEEGGLEEAEEEGINPVMIAVPAVAVLGAVAAYAFMGGKKDKQGEDNGFNADNISLDGFKEGKTEALGAAAIGATGLALIGYSLMSGGTAAPVASGFLATDTAKAVAAATGVLSVGGGIWKREAIADWWNGEKEDKELTKLNKTVTELKSEVATMKKTVMTTEEEGDWTKLKDKKKDELSEEDQKKKKDELSEEDQTGPQRQRK